MAEILHFLTRNWQGIQVRTCSEYRQKYFFRIFGTLGVAPDELLSGEIDIHLVAGFVIQKSTGFRSLKPLFKNKAELGVLQPVRMFFPISLMEKQACHADFAQLGNMFFQPNQHCFILPGFLHCFPCNAKMLFQILVVYGIQLFAAHWVPRQKVKIAFYDRPTDVRGTCDGPDAH